MFDEEAAFRNSIGRLDIQLLRSLLAISRSPTLSSAANQLNIPQPTMSLQMKRLEDRAGRALFEPGRRGKPMRLSVHGTRLVRHAERIIEAYEDAVQYLATPEMEGEVRIGIPDLIAETGIGAVLARLKGIYEDVSLRVVAADADKLRTLVVNGDLDARICVDNDHEAEGRVLWSETFHWVCSPDRACLEQSTLPMGLVAEPEPFRGYVIDRLEQMTENEWFESYTSDSMAKIYGAAAAGSVISAVPRSIVSGDVVTIDGELGLPNLSACSFAMYKANRKQLPSNTDKVLDAIGDFVEDKMGRIVSASP